MKFEDQAIAQSEKGRIAIQFMALSRPGNIHIENTSHRTGIQPHDHDPAGQEYGFLHIMGDEKDGFAFGSVLLPQLKQQVLQLGAGDGIQGAERLIHEQNRGN